MGTTENSLRLLPPQNLDAEQMVLGACLIDPANSIAKARVLAEDFYKTAHSTIFSAIKNVYTRGEDVDIITVSAELGGFQSKSIEAVGGAHYLATLVSLVPTAANFSSHENLVIKAVLQRKIIHACREAEQKAYDLQDPDDLLAEVIGNLNNIRRHEGGEIVSYHQLITLGFGIIERRTETPDKLLGITTGFADIDRMTDGLCADYMILAGRPGMGKTSLAMQIATNTAQAGNPVGVVSIEMGQEQLALREISRESSVPLSRLRSGRLHNHDWDPIATASGRLVNLPISIKFAANKEHSVSRSIDVMVQKYGAKLIIVDYLQLMSIEDHKGNREQEVSKISRMLAWKKKQHGIPILALAQLSRAVEQRMDKKPMLSDLRESGSIEQDADVIMFIHRPECKCPKEMPCGCGNRNKASLLGRKGRMIGEWDVELAWDGRITRFGNYAGEGAR